MYDDGPLRDRDQGTAQIQLQLQAVKPDEDIAEICGECCYTGSDKSGTDGGWDCADTMLCVIARSSD